MAAAADELVAFFEDRLVCLCREETLKERREEEMGRGWRAGVVGVGCGVLCIGEWGENGRGEERNEGGGGEGGALGEGRVAGGAEEAAEVEEDEEAVAGEGG